MSAVQLTQKCTGADRRGNLKDEIHSVVGQKTRGFCSCPKVPGNGVVMIIGWHQEGVKAVVKQKEMACGMFRWDGVSTLNIK